MKWMFLPYRRYFDFSGRSRRLEYWMFTLMTVIVSILFVVLIIASLPFDENWQFSEASPMPGPGFWVGLGGFILFLLGSLIPGIAVTVRRFHDQDLSGWLYLLNFIPYVGGLVVFVFMCLDGTRGTNRFGPDSKDPLVEAEIFS